MVAKLIKKTVDLAFLTVVAVIILAMAVSLAETVFSGLAALVVGIGLLAGAFFAVLRWKSKILALGRRVRDKVEQIPAWKLALFLGVFSAITKILLVFLFDNNADLNSDMGMYRSYAEQYATMGKITENAKYAYNHSHMPFYGLLLSPFAKLFGADTKVFTVALSVFHGLAMVLMFDLLRPYVKKTIAFSIVFLYNLLPFGLLQTQLLIHENAIFFFHILAVWLYMKAFKENTHWGMQLLWVFAGAISIVLGSLVNPAGRVFIVSFGLYALIKFLSGKIELKKCILLICTIAILLGCYKAGNFVRGIVKEQTIEITGENTKKEYSLSYGWSLYVGMNYDSAGNWTQEDKDTWHRYAEMDTEEEALQYQKDLLRNRWKMYEEDPFKIPVHLFNKIKRLWGTQMLPFVYEIGNGINDFVLYGMGGIINKGCILVSCSAFLLIYVMVFLGQWNKMKSKGSEDVTPDLHFRMSIVGFTLALLLFEVTPKYASHMHICFFGIFAFFIKYFFISKVRT